MFLKPFRVKTQTAMKGSDRRKLRTEVGKQFSIESDLLKDIIPNKEDVTVMKLNTHAGKNLIVYNICGNPAFFEFDTVLYPTVYTLWKYPELLPVFTTWPPVFKKLTSGADLMLPGLVVKGEVGPDFMGHIQKGTPCAVKLLGNKSPVAVGTTAMSSEDMYGCAMRGKGVNIIHIYTDQLWAFGSKSSPPQIEDPDMSEAIQTTPSGTDDDRVSSEVIDDNDDASPNTAQGEVQQDTCVEDITESLWEMKMHISDGEDIDGNNDKNTQSPQEKMDELLTQCFMCALKVRVKRGDLPLLASNFVSNHIQPCCPPGHTLDIKKSSFKKFSRFLKAMQEKGYIEVKELSKGVESITEIYNDHPDIRDFTVPDVSVKPTKDSDKSEDGYVPVEIVEMFTVTVTTLPFFKLFQYNKGSALATSEIRNCLTEYIKENKLQSDEKKGLVTLDAILSDLLLNKSEYVEEMPWNEIITRCQAKMSPAYQITMAGQERIVKKGRLEPIKFNIEKRGGNKKVTIIHNLELYGIDPQQFGHEVQINMACSASVSERPGKAQGMELLIQGNQVHFASELLLNKYQIPGKYIHGMEKAPKGKRK